MYFGLIGDKICWSDKEQPVQSMLPATNDPNAGVLPNVPKPAPSQASAHKPKIIPGKGKKMSIFTKIAFSFIGQCRAAQWPTSIEFKIKFDPSLKNLNLNFLRL